MSWFHNKTHEEGPRKLFKRIADHYAGISIPSIKRWLNNNPEHYKTALKFSNKGTFRPIESSTVMGRNQIDLVDYSKKPCIGRDGHTYTYVLSVIDVFSRMLFIRQLQAKTVVFVADQLKEIYSFVGRPKNIQCDNGGEFHGAVENYCRRHRIKVNRSSPYHPQSQGKVERSHGSWKRKIEHDRMEHEKNGRQFFWADKLNHYQGLYNSASHRALRGKLSPFEVFFGRNMTIFQKRKEGEDDNDDDYYNDDGEEGDNGDGDENDNDEGENDVTSDIVYEK